MTNKEQITHKGALYVFGEETTEVYFDGDPLNPPFERVGEIVECMTPKEQLVDDLVHFVAYVAIIGSLWAIGELVNQYVSWEFVWASFQ